MRPLILALLPSCLGDGDGIFKDRFGRDDSGDSPSTEGPTCESEGFGAERSWSLPEGLSQLDPAWPTAAQTSSRRCGGDDNSGYAYTVSTLAGNSEGPDLLLSRDDCDEGAGLGDAAWRLYRNDGGGFQGQSDWTLPEGPSQLDPAWPTTAQASSRRCGGDDNSTYAWAVLDLDGDGAQDLVLTADECEDPDIGVEHWLFYAGRSGGFAEGATRWELPEGFSQVDLPWAYTAQASSRRCGGDDNAGYSYSLADLDGDGRLDLVVTLDPCEDEDLGQSYWRVHFNTGEGFGDGSSFDLPDVSFSQLDQSWAYTAHASSRRCGGDDNAGYAYALLDMTGDGLPDLVNTLDACDDEDLGASYWRIFPNDGAGFGSERRWDLPEGMSQLDPTWAYTARSSSRRCGGDDNSGYSYALLDLTGDGAPDLVHTMDECDSDDPALGEAHWRVYRNNGEDGFDPSQSWALPEGFEQVSPGWAYTAHTSSRRCGGDDSSGYAYTLLDLTGDGLLDLVRTRDDCEESGLGDDRWQVYPGQCGD